MPRVVAIFVFAVALLPLAVPVQAQAPDILNSGRRIMYAERMLPDERIVLDGVLDEPVWARARSAGEFVQQDPVLGATPTERTEVRIAFNRTHLYMGVVCFDSEPDKLAGNTSKRDEFLSADDRFMWTMDTFLNQQTGYFFEMNPAGLMADALMGPGGSNNREWDGIWNARVRQSEIGWVIEIDIPFRTLAFDPNAPAWGINFQRTVRRKSEELLWTGYQRNQGLRRMANAGLLVGLSDVSAGRGFELKPYLAGYLDTPGGGEPRKTEADIGLDAAYNITPSLRAVGTVNTDFAETEVVQRRVNLTRFPLFFPEKRTFFLDGSTFFDFPNNVFFSRQIGLVEGNPQRILGGGKLTGQVGSNDLGALYVRTAEDEGALGEDFLVGRWRRRVLQQSYFGAIYTSRATRAQTEVPTRQTLGVDMRLATSTFRGNKNLEFTGYWVANTTVDNAGDSAAWQLRVNYPNDIWDASLSVQEVQQNYDPALGFTPRSDYRRYFSELRWNPRPSEHPVIRRFSFGVMPFLLTDRQNRMESASGNIQAFRLEMHSGDSFDVSVDPSYERLPEDFEISDGITLPGGSGYHFTRYRISANTASRRVVAFRPQAEWGNFYSGTRQEYQIDVDIRPRPGLRVNTSYEYNAVDLAQGSFDTRLLRVAVDTQFSPFMYLVNNIQYDSVSRVLGWQSRYRWIVRPGNDVFVVYTHNWVNDFDSLDAGRSGYRTLDRRTAAKVVFTKRF
ncbi:MAG: carbohydrate binding family 9 domain-containing protein [Acidobacteria bacterium]|nr:carbohydrate binding family 9 domain-containing protein [Acidobacteriota bacterium]